MEHPQQPEAHPHPRTTRRDVVQWVGLLLPPLAWMFDLQVGYALWLKSCNQGHKTLHFVVAAIALTLVAVGGLAALSSLRAVRAAKAETETAQRETFMAWLGVVSAGFFFLVVVAETLPHFFLGVCE